MFKNKFTFYKKRIHKKSVIFDMVNPYNKVVKLQIKYFFLLKNYVYLKVPFLHFFQDLKLKLHNKKHTFLKHFILF